MGRTRREKLFGSILSMPTFNDDDYNLLLDSQRKHVRWLIDQGIVEGKGVLLIAGGVGEAYMLEDGEFADLAKLVVDEAKGQTPTMVMIAELSARKAARRAQVAADAGVDFVLLCPPHYSLPTEDDIFLHHKYVNDRVDIGLVLYNSFWVMPQPGYSFSRALFERFADLENIVGLKWSAPSIDQYVGMQQLYGDRFVFVENAPFFSQGSKYGMRAFVDVYGNVAPRLSLHRIDLIEQGKFDEYDALYKQLWFEPVYGPGGDTPPANPMVADGPHALILLKAMGLDAGPWFPGQASPSDAYIEHYNNLVVTSGAMDWVDWNQSILG